MEMKELIKLINKNFMIRYKFDDDRTTSLIGAGRFWVVLEDRALAKKIMLQAYESGKDTFSVKLRRGLNVDFVTR